jgi:outer membrane autotransporter protein
MKRITLAVALAVLAVPGTAAAQGQDDGGLYLGLGAGANFLDDTDFGIAGPATVDNEYDTGFALSGQLGYDTGRVWQYGSLRGELELSYRENEIDQHSVTALGGAQPGSTGEASTTALMANVFHDFETGSPIVPYVGGGLGYAWSDLEGYGIQAVPNVLDDDDSGFAWQLGAGVGYELTSSATISLDYRYFSTSADVETSAATGSVGDEVDLDSHTVMVGVRYGF